MHLNRARLNSAGFSLIEMLVTVAIVGLLASIVVPLAQITVQRTKEQELRWALHEIRNAIDTYKQAADEGRIQKAADVTGYPKELDVLVTGEEDLKSPTQQKIYFLRRLPRDPMNTDPTLSAAETWGKRSYASEPAEPVEGEDVYDIYTLHPGIGLNGVAYREW